MVVKATVKGRYEDGNRGSASASLAFAGPDGVRLRASLTDASVVNGPSFEGVALALEKPGAFVVAYDVPKKDVRFQFMNSISVADKPLHLTYAHAHKDNRTTLDGSFVFDPANKVSANYAFGSGNCKVKYTYLHGGGLRTFEPCYDFSKNSWDFSVSHKVYEDDVVKASYQTSSRVLNLDWMRNSKGSSSFKISASMNLGEEIKAPRITAETCWNFDI